MKNYASISINGKVVPTKSITRLRTLIRKRKADEGTYICITPSGTKHKLVFATTVYTGKGYGKKPSGKSKTKKRASWGTYNVLLKSITKVD